MQESHVTQGRMERMVWTFGFISVEKWYIILIYGHIPQNLFWSFSTLKDYSLITTRLPTSLLHHNLASDSIATNADCVLPKEAKSFLKITYFSKVFVFLVEHIRLWSIDWWNAQYIPTSAITSVVAYDLDKSKSNIQL